MRRNELAIDNYYHIVIRGAGGVPFLHDQDDWWLCLKLLYYLNDSSLSSTWERDLATHKCSLLERPKHWSPREPHVCILAFCIHDNHIHLLVKEIKEGGLTAFMRRFPNSLSNRHRVKYKKSGNIFQAAYKLRRLDSDADLQNVAQYIMVKNVLERYPKGGIEGAMIDFTAAWQWANQDNFSSLPDYAQQRNSPLIDKELLGTVLSSSNQFKNEAWEYLKWRHERNEESLEL
jgi:REP element-mobilizing transposase RayT